MVLMKCERQNSVVAPISAVSAEDVRRWPFSGMLVNFSAFLDILSDLLEGSHLGG